LPNILANDWCVPELLQEAATEDSLVNALAELLRQPALAAATRRAYQSMTTALRAPASPRGGDRLAETVLSLIGSAVAPVPAVS